MSTHYRELFYTSWDGLRLFAKEYGPRGAKPTPVICLPGLTRNSRDFDDLALRLSSERHVLCPDFRGRGRSDYCENWTDYTPQNEMLDVLDLMDMTGLHRAVFIGTSRGGIVTMLLAAQRPDVIRAAVLVDVGPEIALEGLRRIAGYVGGPEPPGSWTEAAVRLRMVHERNFPSLTNDDWQIQARRTFRDENGMPKIDYDARIGIGLREGLEKMNGTAPPEMWPQFKALGHVPLLTIRGENSDILTADTLQRMAREHENFASVTVKDRGHVPFLDEPEALAALDAFFDSIDQTSTGRQQT
jgi:pimeloyl-ACP methyl ester carboxylesterase